MQSLNDKRTRKTLSEEKKQELQNLSGNLSQYKKNWKLITEGKETPMVPKPPRTGQVMKSKNPYKLTSYHMFGNLCIDQEKVERFQTGGVQR